MEQYVSKATAAEAGDSGFTKFCRLTDGSLRRGSRKRASVISVAKANISK